MPTTRQAPHISGRVVSVRLDEDIIKRLDALAQKTRRPRSVYLKEAIGKMLPLLEEAYGGVPEKAPLYGQQGGN